ncbi:DegV family protein [Mycoplasma sp. 4404]|uniref:DegV family protein n=1 Tax=Mycoplasma sp. 4404 TaxID=3108530 RepID=UPI002B1DDD11|nr:DegV family protein [Mycoplasma sp. 4404]MEA4162543.1 DegV family protein [Mycoplasma sp. 4404]
MEKIGIIIDSFSGISKTEAEAHGFYYLPLQIEIDKKVYQDGIVDPLEVLEQLSTATDIKTSSPKLDILQSTVKKAAEENLEVIYLGISSKLSSTPNHVAAMSNEYKNIHVVDNHFAGVQLLYAAKYAKKLSEQGLEVQSIINHLAKLNQKSHTFLLPMNLKYLISGGRLSSVKKFIASKVSIYPVLSYDKNDAVSFVSFKLTSSGAIKKLFEKVMEVVDKPEDYVFTWMHGIDEKVNKLVQEQAQKHSIKLVNEQLTSSVISVHTGPEAFAIMITPKEGYDA